MRIDHDKARRFIVAAATALAVLIGGCGGNNNTSTPTTPPPTVAPQLATAQQFLYVANTGSGTISGFNINVSTGVLTPITVLATTLASPLALSAVTGGGLLVAQSVTATGNNSGLATFAIDRATGTLIAPGTTATLTTAPTTPPGTGQFQTSQFLTRNTNSPTGTNARFVYASGTSLVATTIPGTPITGTNGIGTPAIAAFSANADGTFNLLSTSPNVFVVNGVPAAPGALALDPAERFLYVVMKICSSTVVCSLSNALAAIPINPDGSLGNIVTGAPLIIGATAQTTASDSCSTPDTIAVHPSGRFVFVGCPGDGPNGRIFGVDVFAVDTTTGQLTFVQTFNLGTAADEPTALAVDPSGLVLLVAEGLRNSVSVLAIDGATGALTEVTGSPFTTGAGPNGITFEISGRFVYITNGGLLSGANSGVPPSNDISAFSLNTATGLLTPITGSPFATDLGPRSPLVVIP